MRRIMQPDAVAERARIVTEQLAEHSDVVIDQRLFIACELHADLGDDVGQIDFHLCQNPLGWGAAATPICSRA